MRPRADAVSQGQRVLRALAAQVGGEVGGGVVQFVLPALQRGGEGLRAHAPFVLEEVVAQCGVGEVLIRFRGIAAAGRCGLNTCGVGIAPARRPGQAAGAQLVAADVVAPRREAVVLRPQVAGQERAVDAVARIDLQPHAGVARGAAVAVVVRVGGGDGAGVEAVAALMRDAERIVQRARAAAHAGLGRACAVAAQADLGVGRGRAFALLGEELHHAADGVGAIDGGRRAAQHFDAVNLRQRDLLPRRAAGGLRIDPHAVDIDGREAALRPAQENAGGAADAAAAGELHPRQACQQVGHAHGAAALDGVTVEHGNVGHQVGERAFGARGGHHGLAQLGGGGGLRQQGLGKRKRRPGGAQQQGQRGQARRDRTMGFHGTRAQRESP